VWSQQNIAPRGTATQKDVESGQDAAQAQTPVPITPIGPHPNGPTKYSQTLSSSNPWWGLDLGLPGVPIKEVLLVQNAKVDTSWTDYWVRVGDDDSPYLNPSCNSDPIDISAGKEVACDKAGRYVSVVRAHTS